MICQVLRLADLCCGASKVHIYPHSTLQKRERKSQQLCCCICQATRHKQTHISGWSREQGWLVIRPEDQGDSSRTLPVIGCALVSETVRLLTVAELLCVIMASWSLKGGNLSCAPDDTSPLIFKGQYWLIDINNTSFVINFWNNQRGHFQISHPCHQEYTVCQWFQNTWIIGMTGTFMVMV